MQSIVSKGKNVKEAINLGLELLEVEKGKVDVEIIQQETKGFLGLGVKKAVVKLSVKNNSQEANMLDRVMNKLDENMYESNLKTHQQVPKIEDALKETEENLEGKAWVKDGRLYCQSSPSHYPTVSIGKGIKLLKNGVPVSEPTVVLSEHETYEILTTNEEKETVWSIALDQHKLRAVLYVKPGYKLIRKVTDTAPEGHLNLNASESKHVSHTLSYDDIMKKLEFLRVKQGFNQSAILKAVQSTDPGDYEIAAGIQTTNGQDGRIELKVDIDDKQGLHEDEYGKVDFRESRIIPTVERGKVIAVIHPPIPGKPGMTVTGDPLPPKQTLPIELKLGKGVTLVEDKLVATESGRPTLEMTGRRVNVAILPKLIHRGEVNLESGNIRFLGDVDIYGGVNEQMCVEAEGDILVHSAVNFATLTSKGAIIVKKNIVSSELSAGKHNLLIAECGHMLGGLYKQIDQINSLISSLIKSPAFKQADLDQKGLQPLIKLLLEKRFKTIIPLSKQYVEVVLSGKSYFEADEWREIAVSLNQIFLTLSNQRITFDRMLELSEKMKKLYEGSKTPSEPEAYITIFSVLNSKLYSSGNVNVIGQGCVNTKIHAGGVLKVNGVVRGGELYGKQGVVINEAGSEMGTRTLVAVPFDQRIKIKKAMEGTVLKIGNMTYTFNDARYNVEAYLNHEGKIKFS